jgi:hypothetical protein
MSDLAKRRSVSNPDGWTISLKLKGHFSKSSILRSIPANQIKSPTSTNPSISLGQVIFKEPIISHNTVNGHNQYAYLYWVWLMRYDQNNEITLHNQYKYKNHS